MADHPPLTDFVGLDPNFAGGLTVDDYLARQRCGREHLDEDAIRADERQRICAREGHREIDYTQLGQRARRLVCARCGRKRTEPPQSQDSEETP